MIKSLIAATLLTMGVGVSTPTPNFIRRSGTVNNAKNFTTTSNYKIEDDSTIQGRVFTSYETKGTFDENVAEITQQNDYLDGNTDYYLLEDQTTTDLEIYDEWKDYERTFNANQRNIDLMAFKWNGSTIAQNAKLTFTYNANVRMQRLYPNMSLPRIDLKFFVIVGHEELESYYNTLTDRLAPLQNMVVSNNLINAANTNQNILTYYKNVNLSTNSSSYYYTIEEENVEIDLDYLNYGQTSYIFVLTNAYFYTQDGTLQWKVIDQSIMAMNLYSNIKLEYFVPANNINYEVIDVPDLMFTILTTPFAFISQAFNLTLFPGTPYAINISALLLALIGIGLLIVILKLILGRL